MRKISKKRRFHEQVHITDLLFSLGLLCLFTISSLTVLLIGAHVYKQTALDMNLKEAPPAESDVHLL